MIPYLAILGGTLSAAWLFDAAMRVADSWQRARYVIETTSNEVRDADR